MSGLSAVQLIEQMSKASHDATIRLVSLFDILDATLKAGGDLEALEQEQIFDASLTQYCIQLSREVGVNDPETLTDHLLFIAQSAFNQQLNQPMQAHLMHAKKVSEALILAQSCTRISFFEGLKLPHPYRFAMLAVFSAVLFSGFLLWQKNPQQTPLVSSEPNSTENVALARGDDASLTAQEASAMYAKYETMRTGTCQFLEAIQIPDKDKAVYLESVVGGKLPTNLKDLQIANAYLEKVRCNYTPMLMKNSK